MISERAVFFMMTKNADKKREQMLRCFLIAQQIEMAIVNTKAVDIFAVIVPRNLNAQKAKIM